MKNTFKKIIVLTLILSFFSTTNPLNISAASTRQWGETGNCKGSENCYGDCNYAGCPIYTVQKIKTYYTHSECIKIYEQASKISTITEYASYIAGLKNAPVGIIMGLTASNISSQKSFWQKAINLNKGVEVSYEFVITQINANSYSRKGSSTYK